MRSGKKALWVHVCATALLTLLHVGRHDRKTVEAGPLGNYTGTIVHDRLAMYFNYGSGHVPCNAHILRSLNELAGNHRHQDWARGFIELIVDTKCRVDAARADDKAALTVYQQRRIRKRWDDLCQRAAHRSPAPGRGHPAVRNEQRRTAPRRRTRRAPPPVPRPTPATSPCRSTTTKRFTSKGYQGGIGGTSIGRITPAGVISTFTAPSISGPTNIAAGCGMRALWFVNEFTGSIGRITTSGGVTNFSDPTMSFPSDITAGPDGALWFTNAGNNPAIGRIHAEAA